MATGSPDYTQPATIASGIVQSTGGSQVEGGAGTTNADGATWTDVAPTGGRNVMEWFVVNRGTVDLVVAYGAGSTAVRHTLKPDENVTARFNGTIRLRSNTAAAGAFEAVAFEV